MLPVALADCDLVAIARQVVEELSAVHGPRFVLAGDREVHGTWAADELLRSLWNLGVNAVKYGAPNAPITISVIAGKDHATASVHNAGTPIPPDELEGLFRPFVRSTSARRSRAKGWGLGLTLVRGAAEAHGGSVRVESDAESGTTFTLEIPYVNPR